MGKSPTFDELVEKLTKQKKEAAAEKTMVKEADVKEEEVKTAAKHDEACSSGQLDVEPLHQEGESTNQDSVAGGKDNEGTSKAVGGKSKPNEEGEDSGQPAAEAKLVNKPEVEKDAEAEDKVEKEAGKIKGPGIPDGTGPGRGKPGCPFADKADEDKDEDKEDEDKEDKEDKEEKEASIAAQLVKIANLKPEEKNRLSSYWRNIYPPEYVDAMLADK